MTEKELRRLSRAQLLEMLLAQTEKVEQLEAKLTEAQEQLSSRKIVLESVGSIAEASLVLNQVFEAAQRAADQYLENAIAFYSDEKLLRAKSQIAVKRAVDEE